MVNHAFSSPSSSMAISEPSPAAMKRMPHQSPFRSRPSCIFSRPTPIQTAPITASAGITLMKKIQCQDQVSVSQPPIVGPIAGANVAVKPNMASPTGWRAGGSLPRMIVSAVGISTPPVNPWPTRKRIISVRLLAVPHSIEKTRKSRVFAIR